MKLRRIAQNVSSNLAVAVLSALVSLVVTPVMFNGLKPAGLGVLLFASSLTAILESLDLGLYSALVRHVGSTQRESESAGADKVVTAAFYLLLALGTVAVLIFYLIFPELGLWIPILRSGTESSVAVSVVMLGLPFQLAAIALRSRLEGRNDFVRPNVVDMGVVLSRAVAIIAVIGMGGRLIPVAVIYPALAVFRFLALLIANQWHAPRYLPLWSEFNLAAFAPIRRFATLAFLHDTLGRVFAESDALLAGRLLSAADLGFLSVGRRIGWALQRSGQTTAYVAFPMVAKATAAQDRQRQKIFVLIGTRNLLALAVPAAIAVWMYAEQIMRLWIGPAALPSASLARLYVLFALATVVREIPMTVLYAHGRMRPVLLATGIELVVFAVAGSWATAAFGMRGLVLAFALIQMAASLVLISDVFHVTATSAAEWVQSALFPVIGSGAISLLVFWLLTAIAESGAAGLIAAVAAGGLAFYLVFLGIPLLRTPGPWKQVLHRHLTGAS